MTLPARRTALLWTGLWVVVMAAAFVARPLLPMDETRYLAVAWEMWLRGDFLVPYLNFEPYSHKPPALFWLINLGWGVFGVNEWWPRLVAPLFGLASLFLTARLARDLWPGEDHALVGALAPLVAFGGFFWLLYTTLTMFDMILTFCTLLGLIGVVRAWRSGGWSGFALMGLVIGLGVLTKGPAILLHILPVALLAPVWGRHLQGGPEGPGWGRWFAGVLGAVLMGAAIGLAWAIPAGMAGGEAYRDAIFWGQSAGRLTSSFAHARAWWWYAAVLPAMLLPWLIWPPAWRSVRGAVPDGGLRFCLAWIVPAVVVFSLISGKQPHYLLPELAALALILVRLLTAADDRKFAWDPVLPGLLVVALGINALGLARGGGGGRRHAVRTVVAAGPGRRFGKPRRGGGDCRPSRHATGAGRRLRPQAGGYETGRMAAPGGAAGEFQQISRPVQFPRPPDQTDHPGRPVQSRYGRIHQGPSRRQNHRLSRQADHPGRTVDGLPVPLAPDRHLGCGGGGASSGRHRALSAGKKTAPGLDRAGDPS